MSPIGRRKKNVKFKENQCENNEVVNYPEISNQKKGELCDYKDCHNPSMYNCTLKVKMPCYRKRFYFQGCQRKVCFEHAWIVKKNGEDVFRCCQPDCIPLYDSGSRSFLRCLCYFICTTMIIVSLVVIVSITEDYIPHSQPTNIWTNNYKIGFVTQGRISQYGSVAMFSFHSTTLKLRPNK